MQIFLVEYIYVIAMSRKIQWAIILGILFFIGIHIVGSHVGNNLKFSGTIQGLENAIAVNITKRYDKLAWATLFTFWSIAMKWYRQDKKRFFNGH